MIRVAVSPRAYRAIKSSFHKGSVVYPPERNARGQYLLWLSEAEANQPLRAALERLTHPSTRSPPDSPVDERRRVRGGTIRRGLEFFAGQGKGEVSASGRTP